MKKSSDKVSQRSQARAQKKQKRRKVRQATLKQAVQKKTAVVSRQLEYAQKSYNQLKEAYDTVSKQLVTLTNQGTETADEPK